MPTLTSTVQSANPAINPNQALWEQGDFTKIAQSMRESGEALVASLDLQPTHRVLDLGCGDGTTAVPLAQRGAAVLGVDIAHNLVAAGNVRAAEVGLHRLVFQQGDACDLRDLASESFDLTLSIFGAMFAPRPLDVAREMVRVTRRGGRIVMGNWIPEDSTSFVSQLLRISAAYTAPPPAGFVSPMLWGVEAHIIDRFAQAGVPADRIETRRDTYWFRTAQSPEAFIDTFRTFYGPTMNAFKAASRDGLEQELRTKLIALAHEHNRATSGGTAIPATYMRVVVTT
jgi:ubiquinone/menaquinone biosynthesis C-methylase UbiE